MGDKTGAHADIALRRFGNIARGTGIPVSYVWEWGRSQKEIVISAKSRTATPKELLTALSNGLGRESSVVSSKVAGDMVVVRWSMD